MRPVLLLLSISFTASVVAQCVSSFPATENFSSFTTGSPGTLANNWSNLGGDDLDWWVDRNGTPTSGTGPIGDHTSNSTAGNYMYMEATGSATGSTAVLSSPCFDISGLSSPYLTFWYHMNGADAGTLAVDVNRDGSVIQNVWSVSGDRGAYWKQGWISLAPYSGETNLRFQFRAVRGAGQLGDIALDDVVVRSLNAVFGCTDPSASNYNGAVNVDDGTCDHTCPAGQSRVRVDVVADNYPQEITWTLKNGNTGATLLNGTSSGSSVCVPSGTCLVFRINDSYGDGIYSSSYGYGAYSVFLDGVLIRTGGQYGSFEETTFNCPPGFTCSAPLPLDLAPVGSTFPVTLATVTTPSIEAWYDFTPPESGSYTITTCGSNGCDTRLWLYDMQCGQIVLSDGVEGATFANDDDSDCGQEAVVNANMGAGVLHHLRIGDNAGDCGGTVTFSIIFNGPAVGCMDMQSCNFDPLATVPCVDCCLSPGDPECPAGPDLTMSQSALASSLSLSTVNITDACAPVEGCTRGMGLRDVLRFTTRIENIGSTDYYIGSPNSHPEMFDFNNCHGHAHYAGYADYVLFDADGNAIPVGFKNGFCVIDVGCNPGYTGQYGCSNMGISKGCYDIYGSGTTCNWIDITDVPAGQYTLVLRTNWQHAPDALGRHEQDYSNNYAQVCIDLVRDAQNEPSFTIVTVCPPYTDCLGQPFGDARFDCTGACNGTVKMGDLNADGDQTQPDALEYVLGILGDDLDPTTCNDLNGDGAITVTDAALMANCYNEQDVHDQQGHVLHYHPWCDFPRGWLSTDDQVDLKLGAIDPIAGTVDILIRNPTCRVMGYEFIMSGLTIQSVANLAPNLVGDVQVTSALGGTRVIGLSYIDSSLVKNTDFVPLCRISYLALNAPEVCINGIVDIVNADANNVLTSIVDGCGFPPNSVTVLPKVWLEGPYSTDTHRMSDALRAAQVIPATEPYTAMGFEQVGGGGEQVAPGVLSITGDDAVVDWVLVEARSTTVPHAILATRAALLQADGDVVGADGVSPVQLQLSPGTYHIALRHRNHFGAMTAVPVLLSANGPVVDLRSAATATWGDEARKGADGTWMLWSGNTVKDNALKYTGEVNDRDPILNVIGGVVPTGSVVGYYTEDTDLSGTVKYTGEQNDRDPILQNVGGVVPTAIRSEQIP